MSGTLTASSVKPGVRRSKKYTSGRVCDFATCETQISIYNKKKSPRHWQAPWSI